MSARSTASAALLMLVVCVIGLYQNTFTIDECREAVILQSRRREKGRLSTSVLNESRNAAILNASAYLAASERAVEVGARSLADKDVAASQEPTAEETNPDGATKDSEKSALFEQLPYSDDLLFALMHGARDVDVQVRICAADAFAMIGMPDAQPALDVLAIGLDDANEKVREHTAMAFGVLRPHNVNPLVVDDLIKLLKVRRPRFCAYLSLRCLPRG